MTTRLIAGCMTGTSIDSIDAALVRVEGDSLAMTARFLRGTSALLGELAPRLRRLADQEPMTPSEIANLSREFSLAHVPVLRDLIGADKADLIAIHGQTVFHQPPASWQMLTPAPITRELRLPVVFDLRAADLAAGGQGAPITPLADWVFFRRERPLAIVNLGGFCNVTLLPSGPQPEELDRETMEAMTTAAGRVLQPDEMPADALTGSVAGLDLCPCNHILDTISRKLFFAPYDEDGRRAMSGSVHDEALEDLDGILSAMRRSGRSLGTGDETGEWVSRWRSRVRGEDLAATACEAIGQLIAEATKSSERVLLAGGGVRNAALRTAIESCSSSRVQTTDDAGLPGAFREAAAMAVLGALCQDRVPITLPQVTGAESPAPVAGTWVYP